MYDPDQYEDTDDDSTIALGRWIVMAVIVYSALALCWHFYEA